jgi:hypothetical protein
MRALQAHYKLFEWFALLMILGNCVTLAMYSNKPGFEDSSLGKALRSCDLMFLAFFTFEMVVKIIALGLVQGPNTYLRNGEVT